MTFALQTSFASAPGAADAALRSIDPPPDAQIRAQGSDSMESKIDQRESAPRLLALDPRESRAAYRLRLIEMVRDHRPTAGLMLAYTVVGRLVGKSATTVRRVIAGHAIDLDPEAMHACDEAYARHMSRRKARLRAELARLDRETARERNPKEAPDARL